MLKLKKDALAEIKQIVVVQKERPGIAPERRYPAWFCYIGTNPVNGHKVQFTRARREDLVEAVEAFYRSLRGGGSDAAIAAGAAASLRPREALDYQEAREALDMSGFSGYTMLEVARTFVRDHEGITPKALRDAFDEYVASFPAVQAAHIHSVKSRVGRAVFALDANRPVNEITAKDVETMLASEFPASSTSPTTFNNHLNYLRTFFSWCAKPARRYCRTNPAADIEKRAVPYKEPDFMTPEETERLFRAAESNPTWALEGEEIWWLALAFFAGCRAAEIFRLTGKDVNLDEKWVRIARPKGYQHGIVPRVAPLTDNTVAWLRAYPLIRTVGPDENIFTFLRHADDSSAKFRRPLSKFGITIPPDGARHTFITQHVAAFGDPHNTEIVAGTSSSMRVNHYMGLSTKPLGLAHFSIMPSKKVDSQSTSTSN